MGHRFSAVHHVDSMRYISGAFSRDLISLGVFYRLDRSDVGWLRIRDDHLDDSDFEGNQQAPVGCITNRSGVVVKTMIPSLACRRLLLVDRFIVKGN